MEQIRVFLGNIQKKHGSVNSGLLFLLVLRGTVRVRSSERQQTLSERDLMVINHGEFYSLESGEPNVTVWLSMGEEYLERVCREALYTRFSCVSTSENAATGPLYDSMRSQILQIAMHSYGRERDYELLIQSAAPLLLHTLRTQFVSGSSRRKYRTENVHLLQVLEAMEENFGEPVTLEKMAGRFYLSPSYLSRLFKREMGTTYLEYLNSLRLRGARRELAATGASLTRVALNNGFSSAEALNRAFRREFSCTAAEYRRRVKKEEELPDQMEFLENGPESSLDTLVWFVHSYEKRGSARVREYTVQGKWTGERLDLPARVLYVGDFSRLSQKAVQDQIKEAQEAIGFSYVCLEGVFSAELFKNVIGELDVLRVFRYLDSLGLTPFIRVEEDMAFDAVESALSRLSHQEMAGRKVPRETGSPWRFELKETGTERSELLAAAIRRAFPGALLGIFLDPGAGTERPGFPVDFITVRQDPNEAQAPSDAFSYEQFQRHYHETCLRRAGAWMEENGVDAPVWLLDWNTLTGRSMVEAGEFHRTALIPDLLIKLRKRIAGAGFRLNLEPSGEDFFTYPLSLYLYRGVKRPLFFALRFLSMLETRLLLEEDGVLATEDGRGGYFVLLWAPYYMDPFLSLDQIKKDSLLQTVSVTLTGMEKGRYRLKSMYLDKDNGSIYQSWVRVDLYTVPDGDVIEYMENFCNPALALEDRNVEDTLEIRQSLAFNAVAFWHIRKIG